MTFTIVLLALVAAFLGLRLYSVLGKRTGHEQETVTRQPLEGNAPVIRPQVGGGEGGSIVSAGEAPNVELAAQGGLRAISGADRQFDANLFIEGGKSAYRLVLEAYWNGDKDALRFLCDEDVYNSFATEIDGRTQRGETLDNRLVRIDEARIVDATLEQNVARITVRFDADVASLIKDADGNIIGGSLTDAVPTHDLWTFMRDVKSGDRNWKLDETDEV